MIPMFDITSKRGRKILPSGSICFMGFNVSLPASFGVGSPRKYETKPCANSCIMIEIIKIAITKTVINTSITLFP